MPAKKKNGVDRKDYDSSSRKSKFFMIHENEAKTAGLSFGQHLKKAREDNGYSSAESFSQEIGMPYNTYKKYEAGIYKNSDVFFIKYLANKLNVSSDYLLGIARKKRVRYDVAKKETGLSPDSIRMLRYLNKCDDEIVDDSTTKHNGCIDFINCFLGSKDASELFFYELMPMIQSLEMISEIKIINGEQKILLEEQKQNLTRQIANHISKYIRSVVIPEFHDIYSEGEYNSDAVEKYLAMKKKNEEHITATEIKS